MSKEEKKEGVNEEVKKMSESFADAEESDLEVKDDELKDEISKLEGNENSEDEDNPDMEPADDDEPKAKEDDLDVEKTEPDPKPKAKKKKKNVPIVKVTLNQHLKPTGYTRKLKTMMFQRFAYEVKTEDEWNEIIQSALNSAEYQKKEPLV